MQYPSLFLLLLFSTTSQGSPLTKGLRHPEGSGELHQPEEVVVLQPEELSQIEELQPSELLVVLEPEDVQPEEQLQSEELCKDRTLHEFFRLKVVFNFYRTEVYLGSDLWVRVSLTD